MIGRHEEILIEKRRAASRKSLETPGLFHLMYCGVLSMRSLKFLMRNVNSAYSVRSCIKSNTPLFVRDTGNIKKS